MTSDFEKAKQIIERSQRILLTTHERTDGDDYGSISAIALHLETAGKQVYKVVKGGVPSVLHFMTTSQRGLSQLPLEEPYDLLIVSGCSQKIRIGDEAIIGLTIPVLNIDHHPDNTLYGDINVVDQKKSSVAELVYDFFHYCHWPITSQIATCLLTGIFTDTGSFMHSNTQASTLTAAAELMRQGARISTIAKHTYKGKNLKALKAWGKALENAFYDTDKKIIYSVLTDEDMDNLGNIPASSFEGLAETLNKVPEAKFALFLKQDGNIVKGSLRSDEHKGTNVNTIAKFLGGGGHKLASGFSIAGKIIKNESGVWEIQENM